MLIWFQVENLSKLTQRDVDTVTVTIIATANIIRLLRNSVVNLPRNQFLQVKTGEYTYTCTSMFISSVRYILKFYRF